jgi:hypothetical protein
VAEDHNSRAAGAQRGARTERSRQLCVGKTNGLIQRPFSMVVPVFETALRANVELDGNATSHLSLVGMLPEIDLALFLDHVGLLAENAHLRVHLT